MKAAVLGHPVSHSLSPLLHNAAYQALGLDISYSAIETTREQLAERIGQLDNDYVGMSLTMPLKQEVLNLISKRSAVAAETGSANTIFRNAHGDWALENTDVFGITETIRRSDIEVVPSASIIGSGATARSALSALAQLGVTNVLCIARNTDAIQVLQRQGEAIGVDVQARTPESDIYFAGSLVISTVPSSAQQHLIDLIAASQELPALFDIAYNPWPSRLATYWTEHGGGTVLSGKDMLLWQATVQVELFAGLPAPVEAMQLAISLVQ